MGIRGFRKAQRIEWFRQACGVLEAYPHRVVDDQTSDPKDWLRHRRTYLLNTEAGLMTCTVRHDGDWGGSFQCAFAEPARAVAALQIPGGLQRRDQERHLLQTGRLNWQAFGSSDNAIYATADFSSLLRRIMPMRPGALQEAARLQQRHAEQLAILDNGLACMDAAGDLQLTDRGRAFLADAIRATHPAPERLS